MKRFLIFTTILVALNTNFAFANLHENADAIGNSLAPTYKSDTVVYTQESEVATGASHNLVPARENGEYLGYDVVWNQDDHSISFIKGDIVYKAKIDSNEYTKNGEVVLVNDYTKLIDGVSFIPEEFVNSQLINDFYIKKSETFLQLILNENYNSCVEWFGIDITADGLKSAWLSATQNIGGFVGIDEDKYSVETGEDDSVDGRYVVIQQYVKFEKSNILIRYVYNKDDLLLGFTISYYADSNDEVIPEGILETDYKIGVAKTQDAKLTQSANGKSDTVVILVAGSGSADLNSEILGNKVFQDIAWGLAEEGIDTFRFDKVTNSIANGEISMNDLENAEKFTVQDEYLTDVKEVTNMMTDMGYENIYLLGHSQGGMLAPRLYEDNNGVFDGLILLAGSPRTLTDIVLDQSIKAEVHVLDGQKAEYEAYIDELTKKINDLDTMTEEELMQTTIFDMPAYYLQEMNSYDTSDIAKNIDKPILVLQGSKDFQVYESPDFELWKEVLKDNEEAEFILYDNLGHLFTVAPDEPTNTISDYVPAQKIDSRVIDDISKFIKGNTEE